MSLKKFTSSIVLLLSFLHTIIQTTSTPTSISRYCLNTTTFANNTKYQTNLNTLFRSLSDATSNPTGFDITSVANDTSDAVYGLFLCRGDQSITACGDCVQTAITAVKTYCPNRKVAVIWYEECLVRYSNKPLRGIMEQAPEILLINTRNISNQTQFTDIYIFENIMNDLATKAASSNSGKKYATETAKYDSVTTLYGMGQCTPDLNTADCNRCLSIAIGKLYFSRGAQVLQPSCYVRYETYLFYSGPANSSSPPSQSLSPGTNSTIATGKGQFIRGKRRLSHIILFVAIATTILISILLLLWIFKRKRKAREVEATKAEIDEIKMVESLQYNLSTISTATRNFSTNCKLGEGGFGEVYKGALEGGQNIAVKKLSKSSGQGVAEFKTEVVLVAKLQHKNLVKLLGYCVESTEKILVYEFLPNSSLDRYLFDEAKKAYLDWKTRFKIILGVARGLLYLHEDSRLKIIHRDMKPSNILLDEAMNPKISDFGLAKLFGEDETQGDTKRIVGTYGYMAPEYAITGQYSVKSDVYSFGVIMLEIVSGQRSRFFGPQDHEEALLHRVWRLWSEDKALDMVDPTLRNNFPREEIVKCIHIGLLCVQEKAIERPRMTAIVGALTGESISIPAPKLPSFFGSKISDEDHHNISPYVYSGTCTITNVYSRE